MKQVIQDEGSRPIKIWTDEVEASALTQLKNLSRLPFINSNGVACMPDVHAGIGSTVGTVIATEKAVIPAAVGVDIGCGMNAIRLSLKASDLPDNLKPLRDEIEKRVPLGVGGGHDHMRSVELDVLNRRHDGPILSTIVAPLYKGDYEKFEAKAASQLGTLGSGNHFIEICIDENQDVWIMLHSGSRGIGNMIGSHYIEVAKREMEQFFITLPDDNLAYFPEGTENFDNYMAAVGWAQNYALENRRIMMQEVIEAMKQSVAKPFTITQEAINCHHNYVEKENHFGRNMWVTRKGAIRARAGDLGIIPGSMGQRSYIVRGKGDLQSYCSCSHGAGRVMSRAEAKRRFSITDLIAQTEGVECRKDESVIDEIPASYKDIDQVMANQTDLVEVVHQLKQVLCVKGN
jgi:tRNA-splicing ligase RtcB (3'-phosphate/5'-hydroxy nucleic acid ligase)